MQLIWPWQDRNRKFSWLKASAFALMFVPAIWLIDQIVTEQFGPVPLGGMTYWSGLSASLLSLPRMPRLSASRRDVSTILQDLRADPSVCPQLAARFSDSCARGVGHAQASVVCASVPVWNGAGACTWQRRLHRNSAAAGVVGCGR